MKKFLALLLALVCVLSAFAACGGDSETEANEAQKENEKIPATNEQTKYYDIPTNENLKYDINFEEYITLPDFTKLTVDYTVMEKNEETIADQIYNIQLQTAKKTEVTDRAVQEGDVVLIDYSSVLYGTENSVAQSSNVEITIGRNDHDIPELDDAIIGMKTGETKKVDLVYPKNYTKKPMLASAKITATVTLHKIMTAQIPELTDEVIKSFNFGDSVYNEATLKEFIKLWIDEQNLQRKMDAIYQQTLKQTLVTAYPKIEYTYYEEEFEKNEKTKAEQVYNTTFEEYVAGQYGSMEKYNAEKTAYAQKYTTEDMILHALAEKYGVKVTTESYNKALNLLFTERADTVGITNTDDFYNYMGVAIYRSHLLELVFSAVEKDVQ